MNTTVFSLMTGMLAEVVTRLALRSAAMGSKLRYKLLFFTVAVTLVTVATSGIADSVIPTPPLTAAAPTALTSMDSSEIINTIATAVTQAIDKISNSSGLKEIGNLITAFFLVSLTVYGLIKTMASGQGFGEFIGEMVPIFIGFAVVYLFTEKQAAKLLVDMMGTIGSAVTGKTVNMNDYAGAVSTVMEPVFDTVTQAFDLSLISTGTNADTLIGMIANGVGRMGAFIVAFVLKIFTLFLILLSAVIMLATVTMGYMSLQLALALAPIMVPFLMFKPLSWIFDGWLKFVISASMLFIVVVFFQMVTGSMLHEMVNLAVKAQSEQATNSSALDAFRVDYVLYAVMALLALLSGLLMASAPGIANGLISGGSGSIGFGGIRGLAHSTANRAFDGSAKGLGNAAAGGAKTAIARLKAANKKP